MSPYHATLFHVHYAYIKRVAARFVACLLAVYAVSTEARADDGYPDDDATVATPPEPEPAQKSVAQTSTPGPWYGWQTLGVDAVVCAATVATLSATSGRYAGGTLAVSSLIWAGAGPTIHALHHNETSAYLSLTLRVLLPLTGGAIGYAVADAKAFEEPFYGETYMLLGAGAGVIAASVVDAAVLAHGPRRPAGPPPSASAQALRRRVQYAPTIRADARKLELGVVGRF
jgi:hypothetical protein